MKKFLTFLCICLAIIPSVALAGCGKGNNAEDVRNRSYKITVAEKETETLDDLIENQFRISFYDDKFTVEYGHNGEDNYGGYVGTWRAEKDVVYLETLEYRGTFLALGDDKDYLRMEKLTYRKGKLYLSEIIDQYIYRYTFERGV